MTGHGRRASPGISRGISRGVVLLLLLIAVGVPTPRALGDPRKTPGAREKAPPLQPGVIDTERSRVYVFVGKTGLGHEHAIEGRIQSGEVHLRSRKAGMIEFDMSSFAADTPHARNYIRLKGDTPEGTRRKVTENMLSADVLDVQTYPTATFEISTAKVVTADTGAQKANATEFELQGDFTLHGVTRKLTLRARPTPQKDGSLRLTGQFDILQTDFGITPYKAALGTVGVADRLTIFGDLWLGAEGEK